MPLYDYRCSNEDCDNIIIDVEQSIKDTSLTHCSKCGENSLERIISVPSVFCRKEPTTVGQLSERNAKKLGSYEVQERTLKDKDSKKSALADAKKEIRSKINKMNESQKRKYIEGN